MLEAGLGGGGLVKFRGDTSQRSSQPLVDLGKYKYLVHIHGRCGIPIYDDESDMLFE